MNKILIDTNVILDIALNREPYVQKASELIRQIENLNISAFVTATTISDIYYIANKKAGHDMAIEFLMNLVEIVKVAGVDETTIKNALKSSIKDFEDAIQSETAIQHDIEIIITRNESDFENSNLRVLNPENFLKKL